MAKPKSAAGSKPAASTTAPADKPEEKIEPTSAAAAPAGPVDPGETAPAPPVPEQPSEKTAPAVTAPQGAQETPSLEAAKDGGAVEGLWIRSVPESFRRCGFRFTREGFGIALSALTDAQIDQLIADPNLVVEQGEFSDFGERLA